MLGIIAVAASLFGRPLHYGAPVFIGFGVLVTGLTSEAAIKNTLAKAASLVTVGGKPYLDLVELVVHTHDMPAYQALTQRLFTSNANVRNIKTFFSIKRSKFGAELPIPR